jgi:hypothetical protein
VLCVVTSNTCPDTHVLVTHETPTKAL